METPYEHKLRTTVEQVQECSSVRVEKYDPGPIADHLESARQALEIVRIVEKSPLPDELTDNFHRRSNLFFAWRGLEPFQEIAGEFHITHVADVLIRGTHRNPLAGNASETEKLVADLRIFETHPVGGTGTYSALRLTSDPGSAELWYFDLRQGPTRLHIKYGEYLDAMLRTKGLYDWQYLFAQPDPQNYGMRVSLPYLRKGIEFLTHEFPEDDLADLQDRLEQRARVMDETA
ncbi:hypothetical protein ACFV97_24730 [Streptomyces sp. NPDC059913]|uniref:hypothetical protein n=1 Tax=unclassified Streptomyces TaxID=2593676 RepID=UPI00364B9A1D